MYINDNKGIINNHEHCEVIIIIDKYVIALLFSISSLFFSAKRHCLYAHSIEISIATA